MESNLYNAKEFWERNERNTEPNQKTDTFGFLDELVGSNFDYYKTKWFSSVPQ